MTHGCRLHLALLIGFLASIVSIRSATTDFSTSPTSNAVTKPAATRPNNTQRDAAVNRAKRRVAGEPQNWRAFNELGIVYYNHTMYDQAIAAFNHALSLYPITATIEAEQKQETDIANQRVALEGRRQAEIQRQQSENTRQTVSQMMSLLGSVASIAPIPSAGIGIQDVLPAVSAVNSAAMSVSSTPDVAPLSPAAKMASSLAAKREIAEIYNNLGAAYFKKKSYPQAISAFDNALQLDPCQTQLLEYSAKAQFEQAHYDECIAMATRYLALTSANPSGALFCLAAAYRALGMETESKRAFDAGLAKEQRGASDAKTLAKLGSLCVQADRYQEASELLEQAYRMGRTTPDVVYSLAITRFIRSKPNEAIQLLSEHTEKNTSDPYASYILARFLDENGDRGKADKAYRAALAAFESAPIDEDSSSLITICRLACGKDAPEFQAFEKSVAHVPLTTKGGDGQWYRLGLAYEKKNMVPEAIEIMGRCLVANPNYAIARLSLERLGRQVAPQRDTAIKEAAVLSQHGDKGAAIQKLAEACRLTMPGAKKEEIRVAAIKLANGMEKPPPLPTKAQEHYLRGGAALKGAKGPQDLGRAQSDYQWAIFYAPWIGELYFNMSAINSIQNQDIAAINDLKLYLTSKPEEKKAEELMKRLYEFEYQREQKIRELSAAATY